MLKISSFATPACLAVLLVLAPASQGLGALSVKELAAHCAHLQTDPGGVDGQSCIRYIQGFIDGAVETDARIMQDLDDADSLTERAMRTRMPRRGAYEGPGSLAGFCLGDPLPLGEVMDKVVADLATLNHGDGADSHARVAVEDSLRRHFPCPD